MNQLAIKRLWRSPGMYLHDRVILFEPPLHLAIPGVLISVSKVTHTRVDQSVWSPNILLTLDFYTIIVDFCSKADSCDVGLTCGNAHRLFYSLALTLVGKSFNPVTHWSMKEVPRCVTVLVFTSHVGHG